MSASDQPLAPVVDIAVARRRKVAEWRAEISTVASSMGHKPDDVAGHYLVADGRRPCLLAELADADVVALVVIIRDRHERWVRNLMRADGPNGQTPGRPRRRSAARKCDADVEEQSA